MCTYTILSEGISDTISDFMVSAIGLQTYLKCLEIMVSNSVSALLVRVTMFVNTSADSYVDNLEYLESMAINCSHELYDVIMEMNLSKNLTLLAKLYNLRAATSMIVPTCSQKHIFLSRIRLSLDSAVGQCKDFQF